MNFGGAVRINKCGISILLALAILLLLFTYNTHKSSSSSSSPLTSTKFLKKAINDGSSISAKSLLIAAVDVAERGGQEVVQVRANSNDLGQQVKGKTKEGAQDRVTQGDFRSHRVMYYGLRKAFPQVKVISEEHMENMETRDIEVPTNVNNEISNIVIGDTNISAEDISVWIDPLDATQEYTENLLKYVTTMVCVAVKGVPIIGVIHKPFPPVQTYWAIVGYGHSQNLDVAKKSEKSEEKGTTANKSPTKIIVSRSHAGSVRNLTEQILGSKQTFEIITAAGAGYKVLEVIKGNADAYLHVTNIKKWDLCAGNAILNAVEGTMVTLNGEKLDYSPDTDPMNSKGILAYIKSSELSDKFKESPLYIDS